LQAACGHPNGHGHHPIRAQAEVKVMRIYEGDYAYEIEPIIDRATQVGSGWRYNIYRVRPRNEIVRSGQERTREAAEQAGRQALEEVMNAEAGNRGNGGKKPAA
jgi:hypothetical protein